MFIKESFNSIENALVENEIVYLYKNPLKSNSVDEWSGDNKKQVSIKEIKSMDYERLQNYGAGLISISEALPLIAVGYTKNSSYV